MRVHSTLMMGSPQQLTSIAWRRQVWDQVLRRQAFRSALVTALQRNTFPAIIMDMDVDVGQIREGGHLLTTAWGDPITQSMAHDMGVWPLQPGLDVASRMGVEESPLGAEGLSVDMTARERRHDTLRHIMHVRTQFRAHQGIALHQ